MSTRRPPVEKLVELRDKIRALVEPSRRVDDQIHDLLDQQAGVAPPYTRSVDSVLALVEAVLPGTAVALNSFDVQRRPERIRVVSVHLSDYHRSGHGALGDGPTEPLALLVALLTALIETADL